MPTEFYLLNKPVEYTPPSWVGGWNTTAVISNTQMIDTNKYGDHHNLLGGATTTTATPHKMSIFRGVSRKLNPQTISGTVDMVVGLEINSGAEYYTRLHIYVINATTGAVHGTLLNQYEESSAGGGTQWTLTNTGRALQAPQTLTPVTIPSDANEYRLVVELGYIKYGSGIGVIVQTKIRHGARHTVSGVDYIQSPDLALGSTTTNDEAGFIRFSGAISPAAFQAPLNQEPELAITIPTIPTEITIDPLGPENYLWYKYTPTVDTVISGLIQNSNNSSVDLWIYYKEGLGVRYKTSTVESRVMQYHTVTGTDVYFYIGASSYISGELLKLTLNLAPGPAMPGDIYISDDGSGVNPYDPTYLGSFPGTFYNPITGAISHSNSKFPSTELGACLANGIFGFRAGLTSGGPGFRALIIYNPPPLMDELARVILPESIVSIGTDLSSFYLLFTVDYVDDITTPVFLNKISQLGEIDPKTWTLPSGKVGQAGASGGACSCGISRDGSIIYFPHGVIGGEIRRWDLINDVALPNFTTPYPTLLPGDVIVLADGTVATFFQKSTAPRENVVVHYSATGEVLHTFDYGTEPVHHICLSADDSPDKIWIWTQDGNFQGPQNIGWHKFELRGLTEGVGRFKNAKTIYYSWTVSMFYGETGSIL